jgi:hypothetical protein
LRSVGNSCVGDNHSRALRREYETGTSIQYVMLIMLTTIGPSPSNLTDFPPSIVRLSCLVLGPGSIKCSGFIGEFAILSVFRPCGIVYTYSTAERRRHDRKKHKAIM